MSNDSRLCSSSFEHFVMVVCICEGSITVKMMMRMMSLAVDGKTARARETERQELSITKNQISQHEKHRDEMGRLSASVEIKVAICER